MEYQFPIKDIVLRTLKNQDVIDKLKEAKLDVYETTALINSTLGLLILPQQALLDKIQDISHENLTKEKWPIPVICKEYNQKPSLKELIRHLRNSIAHSRITFTTDDRREISGIELKDFDQRKNKATCEASMDIPQLRIFLKKFSELILDQK